MHKLADLESEDLRLIGILNEIRRMVGQLGSTTMLRARNEAVQEIFNLISLALKIVQDVEIKLASERKLLAQFEKDTREMLRLEEMS